MDNSKDLERIVMGLLAVIFVTVFFPIAMIYFVRKNRNIELYPKKIFIRLLSGLLLLAPLILLKFFKYKFTLTHNLVLILILWSAFLGLGFLILPFVKENIKNITTKYLKKHNNPIKNEADPRNKVSAFYGQSMVTGEPLYLDNKYRVMHTLIVGATGSGKTTVLDTLYEFDCNNKTPVIIIDPKGNDETIEKLRSKAVRLGIPPEKFKILSLAKPEASSSYNPLKYGTPIQIKDRLLDALEWSEQFYKTQASLFLINLIEIYYYMNKEITFRDIVETIGSSDAHKDLQDEILKLDKDADITKKLAENLKKIRLIKPEDLSGLKAQINDLNPYEFKNMFSPTEETTNKIDMLEVLNESQIVYFSLNTLNYGATAPIVGRLILQDLKSLTSQIHAKAVTVKSDFLSIYIDEFGSFAFKGFIDWQKMCRDVGFAVHLFFQSMADLNVVSPDFKEQVQSNCINKLILRTDDPKDAEFWASVAGTVDTIEQSYQVEDSGFVTTKTGAGNQRNTKSMLIEHDVFKQLMIGQAVLIQKSPHKVDLVNLYRSK